MERCDYEWQTLTSLRDYGCFHRRHIWHQAIQNTRFLAIAAVAFLPALFLLPFSLLCTSFLHADFQTI